MCGRFSTSQYPTKIIQQLNAELKTEFTPRYKILPTQSVYVIRETEEGRDFVKMRWDLIPYWSDSPDSKFNTINAKAETLAESKLYGTPFKKRRCLIMADGFYEPKKQGTKEENGEYYIQLKNHEPFAFAGLWNTWENSGKDDVGSCTIITTSANPLMTWVHDSKNRMPYILPPAHYAAWLDHTYITPTIRAPETLQYPQTEMEAYKVKSKFEDRYYDGIETIKPISSKVRPPL